MIMQRRIEGIDKKRAEKERTCNYPRGEGGMEKRETIGGKTKKREERDAIITHARRREEEGKRRKRRMGR